MWDIDNTRERSVCIEVVANVRKIVITINHLPWASLIVLPKLIVPILQDRQFLASCSML